MITTELFLLASSPFVKECWLGELIGLAKGVLSVDCERSRLSGWNTAGWILFVQGGAVVVHRYLFD